MQTREIAVYEFDELSDEAKDKVRQTFTPHDDWHECIYDDFIEDMKELGGMVEAMWYSGFWSQGDGASWEGSVDMEQYLLRTMEDNLQREVLLQAMREGYASNALLIRRKVGHYAHDGCMYIDDALEVYAGDEECFAGGVFAGANVVERMEALEWNENALAELISEVLAWAKEKAGELYKNLETEYEYQRSDEYLKEMCDSNEYVFTEDGALFGH